MENTQADINVKKLVDGLGYGNDTSSISVGDADVELMKIIDDAVHSPQVIAPVSIDDATGEMVHDDGCGDGRACGSVFTEENGSIRTFKRSLHRPKVFGGGATMTAAMLVGDKEADSDSEEAVFAHAIQKLREHNTDFGAHTDGGADDTHCGCGAIDKFPDILAASVTYHDEIAGSIQALGIETTGLQAIQDNFRSYAEKHMGESYNGHNVSDAILHEGKVVKELSGSHIEKAVVLNTVPGYTVDQCFVRKATNGKADVFAVDVWHMQELTDKLFETAQERHAGLLSQLVYTLATASVLTHGNLPVYIVTAR